MTSIRVGPITYEIQPTPHLLDGNNKLDGKISYNDSTIRIDSDCKESWSRIVLWHELFHAMLTHAGYYDHMEGQLDVLAAGVVALFQDNPGLMLANNNLLLPPSPWKG